MRIFEIGKDGKNEPQICCIRHAFWDAWEDNTTRRQTNAIKKAHGDELEMQQSERTALVEQLELLN